MGQEEFVIEESILVGRTVEYSIKRDVNSTGLVLDKILGREKATDDFAVTKYLIEDDDTREVVSIVAWRIHKVFDEDAEHPRRHLEGGYRRDQ